MVKYTNFVGIDQSYSSTGVVSIKGEHIKANAFKAGSPRDPFHIRLDDLIKKIKVVLPDSKSTLVFMEGAAYAATFNVFMLGELSGALKMFLYQNGYDYEIIQPTTLKKFATGNGKATKKMIQESVQERWDFKSGNDDINDAFVLARMAYERMENE